MPDQPTQAPESTARSAEAATALIHLYRGELGRMTSYRRRCDTTTNWAISFVSAAVGYVLSAADAPHVTAIVAMAMLAFFVSLEADRFRRFEASRHRVRLLERGFFTDTLRCAPEWPWLPALLDHLQNPTSPLDQLTAAGLRLRRTYLWIYVVLFGCWLLKLHLVALAAGDRANLVAAAAVGSLPGSVVMVTVLAFYGWLASAAIRAGRRYTPTDDT